MRRILPRAAQKNINIVDSFELASSVTEIKHTYTHLDQWTKPEKAPFSLNWSAMRPVVYKEPKGVVLIISPFNYPVFLCIPVLVGQAYISRI